MSPAPSCETVATHCPSCGYDLRGNTGERCPECGAGTDEQSLRAAQVPWTNRAQIGRTRALIATVWRVTFLTGRFCHATCLPVDYAEARRFQRTVVGLLWMTTVIMAVACWLFFHLNGGHGLVELFGWTGFTVAAVALGIGWYLFLLLATGVHTYWFHPKSLSIEQQNRALALSYYASGVLLWLIPCLLLITIGFVLIEDGDPYSQRDQMRHYIGLSAFLPGVLLTGGMLLGYLFVCFQMAAGAAKRDFFGRWSLPLAQPLLIALIACFTVLGLPFTVGYLWLIAYTW